MSSKTNTKKHKNPKLRFNRFSSDWFVKRMDEITTRALNPVSVQANTYYQQIGIRSHGKGLFYKEAVSGASLGSKRIFWITENALILNIVFAWEQAVAKTTKAEIGMVASHRFPMYLPIATELNLDYILYLFLTKRGKHLLGLASPGGAGRNKTLGQNSFGELKINLPEIAEQQKIVDFLNSVNQWIDSLKLQKKAIEKYKRGIMKKLFTQEIRFKDDRNKHFPKWTQLKLGDVFTAIKGAGISKDELTDEGKHPCILYGELYTTYKEVVFEVRSKTNISSSVKSKIGDLLIPCSTTTSAIDLSNVTALNIENVSLGGDITILRSKNDVSNVFYAYYLSNYKKHGLAKYGQGATIIHLYYSHFSKMSIDLPSLSEQQKIADFLQSLDMTISSLTDKIAKAEKWKKGLMQKIFV